MTSVQKVYNIPVYTNEEGHKCIDMAIFKLMQYVNSFGFDVTKKDEEKITVPEKSISDFKTKLYYLFFNTVAKESNPWKNPENIIGEAPGFDMCFNKEKLVLAKPYIIELLNEIGDVAYFSDLSILNNGTVWTDLKQDIQKLLALASAAGIIDYKKTMTNMMDENPEISINR